MDLKLRSKYICAHRECPLFKKFVGTNNNDERHGMIKVTDGERCCCTMHVDTAEGLLTTPVTYELKI